MQQYTKMADETEEYYKEIMTSRKCQDSIVEHHRREMLTIAARNAAEDKARDHVLSGSLHEAANYCDEINQLQAVLSHKSLSHHWKSTPPAHTCHHRSYGGCHLSKHRPRRLPPIRVH